MGASNAKRILVVVRRSPYGSSLAKASIDLALAAAAFEQPVDLLFMGDGVLQLLPNQESSLLGVKNIGRQLTALPLFDINCVYLDSTAVTRYTMDLSGVPVETRVVETGGMGRLMLGYDVLLGF